MFAAITHQADKFDPFVCEQVAKPVGKRGRNLVDVSKSARAARITEPKTRCFPDVVVCDLAFGLKRGGAGRRLDVEAPQGGKLAAARQE